MDNFNAIKPNYYKDEKGKQCIDYMLEKFGKEAVYDFCVCNAYKYSFRAGKKNGNSETQDLKKAKWYLDYALDLRTKIGKDVQFWDLVGDIDWLIEEAEEKEKKEKENTYHFSKEQLTQDDTYKVKKETSKKVKTISEEEKKSKEAVRTKVKTLANDIKKLEKQDNKQGNEKTKEENPDVYDVLASMFNLLLNYGF